MKKAKLFLMLALLMMGVNNVFAQDVTIRANNGSTIAAIKDGGTTDSFFGAGGFATWQHEQLAMVMTVSDNTDLTTSGQLENPANNLFSSGNYMQIGKGQASGANTTYVSLSLPKGYRFTEYHITFSKSNETKGSGNGAISFDSNVTARFGETNSSFTYTNYADVTNNGGTSSIDRIETETSRMGNVLYFRLQNTGNSQNNRVLITLESAQIFFTAEENYAPVLPVSSVNNVSAVDIPFETSKVDYGSIQNRPYTINGQTYTRMSYASSDVTDLTANMVLYEAESIKDGSHFDGTSGKIVDYKAGTISSQDGFFKLGRENQEQVYYIESPTYVTLSDGSTKNPIGYRIVGADIVYRTPGASTKHYITYEQNGTTYYLGTNGQFSTTKTEWETDDNGRVHSGNTYLGYTANIGILSRTFTFRTYNGAPTNPLYIDSNNRIYGRYTAAYVFNFTVYLYHNGNNAALSENTNNLATWSSVTESPNSFTLKVYDKEGNNPVSYTNGQGTAQLTGLNNDAVKFGVEGIGLIRATLTLQAIDPYLDQMEVFCNDKDYEEIKISRNFSASDFSVNGGEFFFNVPVDTKNVAITFENLKSKYFDETYDGGKETSTSRINFVQSQHNQAFGTTTNNIYDNITEAANSTLESTRIANNAYIRTKVSVVGTEAFKFNNADEVGTTGGTLTEYPFTFAKYFAAPNSGAFDVMEYDVKDLGEGEEKVETRYVFTTDETRYNIAPTTAIQHRAYAYYKMIVHVSKATYEPKIKFTKVYDNTFYVKDGTETQGEAMYGVEVTAPYTEDGKTKQGYASTKDIYEGIERILKTDKVDDFGNTDLPETSKQIIYLDFSKLAGVYQITTDEHQSMEDYAATGARNCLIFLPKGSSAPNDNVAALLDNGVDFKAVNNIVITDKQPFFTPYKISVDAAKVAEYKREITSDQNGKVVNATVVLPFTIAVENGLHINDDNSCSFTVNTMNATNSLAHEEGSAISYGVGYFKPIEGTATESNKPYVLQVVPSSWTDANSSFLVRAHGATIEATPTGGVFTNESATGTYEGATYNFTHKGTYTGKVIKNAASASETVFYFAHNYFLDSKTLTSGDLYIFPFRSFYAYTTSGGSSGAKMTRFSVVFGENENDNNTTGISKVQRDADLAVIPGDGTITLMAKTDKDVTIHAVNGLTIDKCNLRAGESRTVAVPAGIYVINGVKMVVK